MSIDGRNYLIYEQTNTEFKYLLPYGDVNLIIQMIIGGAFTNFQQSDFFQQTSDYITKILFLPFFVQKFFPEYNVNIKDDTLHVGKLDASAISTLNLMKPLPYLKIFEFTVTRKFNNFLDFAPYRKLTLFIPYFKELNLDPQMIYGNTITGYMSVDFTTGNATMYIYASKDGVDKLLDAQTANFGIEVSIGRTNAEEQRRNRALQGIEIVGSVAGAVVGTYTGQPLVTAASITKLTHSFTKALANEVTRLTGYKGSTGTRNSLAIDKSIYLIDDFPTIISQPDASLVGKPCRQVKNLSSLTGYTQVGEINFNRLGFHIYDDEISEIVSLLKSGVIL